MSVNLDYSFNGWDYCELAEAFGLIADGEEGECRYDDDKDFAAIIEFFGRPENWDCQYTVFKYRSVLDNFLKALIKETEQCDYHKDTYLPLYRLLLSFKDDFAYVRVYTVLVPIMWN